ncbi:hypothetical protein [Streptomyces sp. NPDC002265]|uniref:hypothetical protein n=1 Tax=Streptomyces sp. NPDC002265 TaxID=3154415 RepID=UPI00332F1214
MAMAEQDMSSARITAAAAAFAGFTAWRVACACPCPATTAGEAAWLPEVIVPGAMPWAAVEDVEQISTAAVSW